MTKFLIIESSYYKDIQEMLLTGASEELKKLNIDFDVVSVPGCFEIPAALSMAMELDLYDGFVVLGCVIRGETAHFDYVSSNSLEGVSKLANEYSLAVGCGILTVENKEQAIVRADVKQKNKGGEAANCAYVMHKLKDHFQDLYVELEDEDQEEDFI